MDLLGDALSISGMAIVMVFAVLLLLMLAMHLSASIIGRSAPAAPETGARPVAPQTTVPAVKTTQETDQQHMAVIFAALQAAEVDLPSGGRIRIEKVSRRS